MSLRNAYATPPASFAEEVGRKVGIRYFVAKYSIGATLFWLLALVVASWLVHFGLTWFAWTLLAVWVYFALPSFVVQAQLIIDVLSYGITGNMHFFPLMQALVDSGEAERRELLLPTKAQRFLRVTKPVFLFVSMTVPSIGIALWCSVVLARAPEKAVAHTKAVEPRRRPTTILITDIRQALKFTRAVEVSAVSEFAGKQFMRAAM